MSDKLVVPVFPLASVVLVPGAFLPLHVFEPRYRAMVADAMAGPRLIAMAMPLPLREGDDPDRPRLHPVTGLGRIVHHQQLEDGRSDIVLAGVTRMRTLREIPSEKLYRLVHGEELPDGPVEPRVAGAVAELLERVPGLEAADREKLAGLPPGAVLDAILLRLDLTAREKHRVHASPDVAERFGMIVRTLARMAGVRYDPEFGPGDPRLN